MLKNFYYGFLIKSTGFSLEIFMIGKTDEIIAVSRLMLNIMINCLIPKIAKDTEIFIILIIYILTNIQPRAVIPVAKTPFIIAITMLSKVNIVNILLLFEPRHLSIPIVGRLFTTLVEM